MRRLTPILLATALFTAACSDQGSQPPTATDMTKPEATLVTPPGCPTDAQIHSQIHALFPQGLEDKAELRYAAVRLAMIAGKTTLARQLMYNTVDWTLKQYNGGLLIGGKSSSTQANVITFINSLYCIVGLPLPAIPPGALGPDGAAAVVSPSSTLTDVVTQTLTAGIEIAPNGVAQPTLITISRVSGPLLTQLDQYPLYYEFRSDQPLNQNAAPAVVGVCIARDLNPPDVSRLRVAHNVPDPNPTTIEILPLAPAAFLNCANAPSAFSLGPSPTLQQFARWGLGRAGQVLRTLFSPAPLAASFVGQTGIGGQAKGLSPFGVVDTLITVSAMSPTSISGVAGSSVSSGSLPSVRVATPTNRPVTTYPVTFAVPAGSEGSITGGAATTNASGIATVGSWTLGSSLVTDLVNAAVAPPHLRSGVQGSPVSFSASVVSLTVVSYLSSGYAYELIGNDAPPTGWATPAYDASNWSAGGAAFGSGPGSPNGCALDANVQTQWPAGGDVVSRLLLRKSVNIPTGWTGSLSIAVAIDNDVQVFVNGVDITGMDGGFQTHEGCATQGSFVFTAPNNILVPGGNNVIAVYAQDRGGTSYFDMEATLVPAVQIQ